MMNVRTRRFAAIGFCLSVFIAPSLRAQFMPEAGSPTEIVYKPSAGHAFASADSLQLVYTFNLWGSRHGTRLALLENVLRPDSHLVRRARLERAGGMWTTRIDIPPKAALLSYYVTDGRVRDDNGEKTYAFYVYGKDGKPVKNARFFMTQFLMLARESLDRRLREAEDEIVAYPDNFAAYPMFFTLLFEREKGNERCRKQILERLTKLEQKYADSSGYNNLAARTFFYTLRDVDNALAYKEKVPITQQWPDVILIYDRDKQAREMRRIRSERERVRNALLGAEAPVVSYTDSTLKKHSLGEFKGRALLILFWANTSAQSIAALDNVATLRAKMKLPAFDVLALNVDFDFVTAKNAVSKMPFDILHGFKQGNMLEVFGVDGIPQAFLIDTNGVVRAAYSGMTPADLADIENRVRDLLEAQ